MNVGKRASLHQNRAFPAAELEAASTGPASLPAVDRASRDAAITLGLALPGDTVLYLLLPLHVADWGIGLPEAGLLLAANRLVRIAGYGWVARCFERYGARVACIGASIGAVAATLGYAVLSGVVALLCARLLWGLSFAALNIATQALATAEPRGASRRSGRARAIIAIGPMIGLLGGAVLAETAGPRIVFAVLAAIAAVALPFAMRLPAGPGQKLGVGGRRLTLPSPLDLWSFVQGLTMDGVFVVGLAVLASAASPHGATVAAGAALALRYLAEIALGPPGGVAAERWGGVRVLVLLSLGTAAGLAAIGAGALWAAVVAIVLLRGMLQPLPAPVLAAATPGAARVPSIARMSTWRDLGAGVGPLFAGIALPLAPRALYLGSAALLAAATLILATSRIASWRLAATPAGRE